MRVFTRINPHATAFANRLICLWGRRVPCSLKYHEKQCTALKRIRHVPSADNNAMQLACDRPVEEAMH